MKPDYDLVIAGGGPAGSAAAITAARGGKRVLLLERGRLPRHKVCGEFVSGDAVGLLQGLLGGGVTELERFPAIEQARLLVGGATIAAQISPRALSVPRFDLDRILWQAAEAAGAECRQGCGVARVHEQEIICIVTDAGEVTSRWFMNASGRWSNLRGDAAVPLRRWIGVKAHFEQPGRGDSVDVYFFRGGYCGVQPVGDGRVNACVMVRADAATNFEQLFALDHRLRERARAWKPVFEPLSTAPLFFSEPQPVNGSVLNAGDAAGFIDPFLGDGISLALHSGTLAAQALEARDPFQWYAREYRRRFLPAFRRARILRTLLGAPGPLRQAAARAIGALNLGEPLVRATRVSAAPRTR